MTELNISIPDSIKVFVDSQVGKGPYTTASEYITHLIRQDQKRAEEKQLETLLLEGLNSGEPIEVTDEWWERKRSSLVEGFRRQQTV